MAVYLDIDLDFLVKPIRKESINNVRMYKYEECSVDNVDEFIELLKSKGLLNSKDKKFFTNHKKSYTYWWIKRLMDNTLIHIDAHSDLYRNKNRNLTLLRDTDMGCDDYIWFAIRDGFISKIIWVIPDGLYDLSEADLAKKFIPEDMILDYRYEENQLKIKFEVDTRIGNRVIEYCICNLLHLPAFENIEMMTVATSPEFTSESCDKEMMRALTFLGASEDEITRIMKLHKEMPHKL
ncbi:hypothetical protein Q428_04265 [Fervidicella metallireducens AeB]|uniref:Uncharacterized protein n=1 Tax=Fervidicella metallireducens AeB TaxID=1403537 RepID=A0A017RWL3_9CLOT|nr:hypothetical protein [Fervidicella metallireducens]EYE89158.1 hypothetical protein Q428_04265 [Fervidicella metallireducens AeB]